MLCCVYRMASVGLYTVHRLYTESDRLVIIRFVGSRIYEYAYNTTHKEHFRCWDFRRFRSVCATFPRFPAAGDINHRIASRSGWKNAVSSPTI